MKVIYRRATRSALQKAEDTHGVEWQIAIYMWRFPVNSAPGGRGLVIRVTKSHPLFAYSGYFCEMLCSTVTTGRKLNSGVDICRATSRI